MATRKSKNYDQKKGVKRLARERVGTVKPARPITSKLDRPQPKHKRPPDSED